MSNDYQMFGNELFVANVDEPDHVYHTIGNSINRDTTYEVPVTDTYLTAKHTT